MPLQIDELPVREAANDADLILIRADGVAVNPDHQQTRGDFLAGVARDGGDHDFGTSEIDALTAGVTALTFASTAVLSNLVRGAVSVAPANITAGSSETVVVSLTGVLATDYLLAPTFAGALPAGMIMNAWISADGSVSFRFTNTTGGTINGATYTAHCVALRFA